MQLLPTPQSFHVYHPLGYCVGALFPDFLLCSIAQSTYPFTSFLTTLDFQEENCLSSLPPLLPSSPSPFPSAPVPARGASRGSHPCSGPSCKDSPAGGALNPSSHRCSKVGFTAHFFCRDLPKFSVTQGLTFPLFYVISISHPPGELCSSLSYFQILSPLLEWLEVSGVLRSLFGLQHGSCGWPDTFW